MPSLLDFLSGATDAASRGVAAHDEGKRKGLLDLLAQQDADASRTRQQGLDDLNRRNLESMIAERNRPSFALDPKNSRTFNRDTGEFTDPKQGTQTAGPYEERNERGGVSIYENGKFLRWKVNPPNEPSDRVAAATVNRVAENRKQLTTIDRAIQAITAYPEAVGASRALGTVPFMGGVADFVNQRVDPQGVEARALLSNIGSLIIHDRSGAAVSVSEFPRLSPFIPAVGDTPEAALRKLALLKQEVEAMTAGLEGPQATPTPNAPSVPRGTPVPRPSAPRPAQRPSRDPIVEFESIDRGGRP